MIIDQGKFEAPLHIHSTKVKDRFMTIFASVFHFYCLLEKREIRSCVFPLMCYINGLEISRKTRLWELAFQRRNAMGISYVYLLDMDGVKCTTVIA